MSGHEKPLTKNGVRPTPEKAEKKKKGGPVIGPQGERAHPMKRSTVTSAPKQKPVEGQTGCRLSLHPPCIGTWPAP